MRRLLPLAALLCALPFPSLLRAQTVAAEALTAAPVAPELAERIREEGLERSRVMAYLDGLTNEIGHRLTGSDNFTRACEWARAEFERMGLSATLEKWDTWPLVWNRGQWSGRVVEPVELELQVATPAWTAGTRGRVRARLVPAPKDAAELAARKGELAGCYVYRTASGGRRRFGRQPDPFANELRAAAEAAGIAGWVESSAGDDEYPNRIRVFGDQPHGTGVPEIPEIVVRYDQAQRLEELLEQGEVTVEFDIRNRFRVEPIDLHNVIAEIPGSEKPEEVVIVCGHLDSWHQATGTTDNGTGTTSTLEAARILAAVGARPKRTIRFCLWGGEEQGLLGSRAYVQRHRTEMGNVSAVLNHDTGTNWAQSLTVNAANEAAMRAVLVPVMRLTPPDPDFDRPVFELRARERISGGGGSDHASFISARVPAFAWGLEGRSDYFGYTWHSQWDTFDVAIPEYQRHTATVIALTALGIANLPEKLSSEGVEPSRGNDLKAMLEGYLGMTFGGEGDLDVRQVEDGGTAAAMGFAAGDRILRVGDHAVTSLVELMAAMREVGFRNAIFTVRRGDAEQQLEPAPPRRRRGDR